MVELFLHFETVKRKNDKQSEWWSPWIDWQIEGYTITFMWLSSLPLPYMTIYLLLNGDFDKILPCLSTWRLRKSHRSWFDSLIHFPLSRILSWTIDDEVNTCVRVWFTRERRADQKPGQIDLGRAQTWISRILYSAMDECLDDRHTDAFPIVFGAITVVISTQILDCVPWIFLL